MNYSDVITRLTRIVEVNVISFSVTRISSFIVNMRVISMNSYFQLIISKHTFLQHKNVEYNLSVS
jgi:hypothetical protein